MECASWEVCQDGLGFAVWCVCGRHGMRGDEVNWSMRESRRSA